MQLDAAELRISSPVLMSVLKPDHTAALLLLNVTPPPVPLASHPPPALFPKRPFFSFIAGSRCDWLALLLLVI